MDLIATSADIALIVRVFNEILTSICQLLAIFIIAVGVIRALVIFLKDLLWKEQSPEAFQKSRLAMGYSFSLGLSFLVGASILKTMFSSKWDDIARLAAIIAVRTILNYLLFQSPGQRPSLGKAKTQHADPPEKEAIAS
ncbi:MAG: DUF1622 domain-containing protein [Elainellaceae cyanobacterium]